MIQVYDPVFEVLIGSHFFTVKNIQASRRKLMYEFSDAYVHVGLSRGDIAGLESQYFSKTIDSDEWRFHLGQYKSFVRFMTMRGTPPKLYTETILPLHTGESVKLPLKDWVKPRDYQVGAVEFITDPSTMDAKSWLANVHSGLEEDTDLHSRLISAPTGTGKTVMAAMGLAQIAKRVMIVILPKYMEKWAGDLTNLFELKKKDIGMIAGSDALKGFISLKDNPKYIPRFTIVSLTTYRNFIKSYEEGPSECRHNYGLQPDQLCQALNIGVILIDEGHEHIHAIYRLLVHSHVPRIVSLSGTMRSDDQFIEAMQKLMFPKSVRYENIEMKKYIQVFPISYIFKDMQKAKIRTVSYGSRFYSHNEFEASIIRRDHNLASYLKLIEENLKSFYLDRRKPGQKAAIYASSIKMCTIITDYLKEKYPELDIRRYCESDPYENIIESDIRVTTIQSGGTAIDIPNLITVLLTVSISSSVSNLQVLGRLREIEGVDVQFVYLFCEQIKKQVDYHFSRMKLFRPKVASIKHYRASTIL